MNNRTGIFCEYCGNSLAGVTDVAICCPRCMNRTPPPTRVLVACCVIQGERLLWIRRAFDPRRGYWTIPSGFVESGETLAQGAARELVEETGLQLEPNDLTLYGTGSLAHINEVYVVFRTMVGAVSLAPGEEALEARFFSETELPWDDIAFPTATFAIRRTYDDIRRGSFGIYLARHDDGMQIDQI